MTKRAMAHLPHRQSHPFPEPRHCPPRHPSLRPWLQPYTPPPIHHPFQGRLRPPQSRRLPRPLSRCPQHRCWLLAAPAAPERSSTCCSSAGCPSRLHPPAVVACPAMNSDTRARCPGGPIDCPPGAAAVCLCRHPSLLPRCCPSGPVAAPPCCPPPPLSTSFSNIFTFSKQHHPHPANGLTSSYPSCWPPTSQ
jgi:hypothetical protein